MSFSVIVTSYNYRPYLGQAVDSAAAQRLAPREILIVDDGSSDGSAAWAREHYAADSRIRVIEQSNTGQLGAFARGVAEAAGDWVAFLDADDRWDPGYLEQVVAVLAGRPSVDFVYTNLRFEGARQGQFHPPGPSRDDGISVLQGAFGPMWRSSPTSAICLRRSLARRLTNVPPDLVDRYRSRADDCLSFGADILSAHKYYLDEPLVTYRDHGGNAWLGQGRDAADQIRHWARTQGMVAHYRQLAGIEAADRGWLLRQLKREFLAKPAPTRQELERYSELLDGASLGLLKRWRDRWRLHRHFRATRRRAADPAN
jgi:glycosyltransferase involved in cell wall biosynthesis